MKTFADPLHCLQGAGVEFIVIGGVAVVAHGMPRLTNDLDLVYKRSRDNVQRLVDALQPYKPYLRGAPAGLPFRFDAPTVLAGLNFTLVTELGWIDLLGEVAGGGGYDDLLPHSTQIDLYGVPCRVLDLETLIRTKRAAGRPKDFESIAELELIRERQLKAASKVARPDVGK